MYKVLVALLSLLTLASLAAAQDTGFSDVPKTHWAASSVQNLLTRGILAPQGATKAPAKKPAYKGDAPVTRYELAVVLWRFVQHMENANKQPKTKTGAQLTPQEAAKQLVAGGYLPKNSPIAKAQDAKITSDQLVEAMTLVIARIKEKQIPVTPDSKYAPIQRPGM
jgi:hypothetical protein